MAGSHPGVGQQELPSFLGANLDHLAPALQHRNALVLVEGAIDDLDAVVLRDVDEPPGLGQARALAAQLADKDLLGRQGDRGRGLGMRAGSLRAGVESGTTGCGSRSAITRAGSTGSEIVTSMGSWAAIHSAHSVSLMRRCAQSFLRK